MQRGLSKSMNEKLYFWSRCFTHLLSRSLTHSPTSSLHSCQALLVELPAAAKLVLKVLKMSAGEIDDNKNIKEEKEEH